MWRKFNFQENAGDYIFKGRRPGEEIVLFLRRHWLILVFNLIPAAFLLGVVVIVFFWRDFLIDFLDIEKAFFDLIYESMILFFWILLFILWIDYYLDVWIVTDQRIINVEQNGLFRRSISELEIGKIQDVTSEVTGVIPTLFDYGYVYIQTAGEKERFIFQQVPNPSRVKNVIMQIQKKVILEEKREEGLILKGKL